MTRLREMMQAYCPVTVAGLPRFVGGAVGYFSYDTVRTFEELPALRKDDLGLPDFAFLLTDTLLIFDNVSQKIKVVANAHVTSTTDREVRKAYRDAADRIESMIARLKHPLRRSRPTSPEADHLHAEYESGGLRKDGDQDEGIHPVR